MQTDNLGEASPGFDAVTRGGTKRRQGGLVFSGSGKREGAARKNYKPRRTPGDFDLPALAVASPGRILEKSTPDAGGRAENEFP
jgi:hypothetical protein